MYPLIEQCAELCYEIGNLLFLGVCMNETTLYKRNSNGSVQQWSISGSGTILTIIWGREGGKLQTKTETITQGKAARSQEQQMESRIASRISKQRDKGYGDTPSQTPQNGLGFKLPMLATSLDKISDTTSLDQTTFVQYKYDGHRCLITKKNGVMYAYSRNGKNIDTIPHILQEASRIAEGETLDGELYIHGESLQTISSYAKKRRPDYESLRYKLYDVISNDPFIIRLTHIRSLFDNSNNKRATPNGYAKTDSRNRTDASLQNQFIELANTWRLGDIDTEHADAVQQGYEGLILRRGNNEYESGKRSKDLIKVKSFQDDEFAVYNITKSSDGWGILHLSSKSGIPFTVTAPGTFAQKCLVATHYKKHIGKKVNVKYAYLTADGVPFHPVATMWRNPDSE